MSKSPKRLARLNPDVAGGMVLLLCTLVALIVANSPFGDAYHHLWEIEIGGLGLALSLEHWINDGLMVVFFFVIGLEVKRELVLGELRDPRRAVLPIVAAVGGMVVPAAVYLALQGGTPNARGWGIPMATDIAFVVGCLALLGRRVPPGLRILLLTLAIADDVGAILVIAIGYAEAIHAGPLLLGAAGIAAVVGLQALGVRSIAVYALVGAVTWLGFLGSGVHATVAGVILGLLTPARPSSRETVSPLARLEKALHPWVSFVVMPVFALANAGVRIETAGIGDPVALAVAAGLAIGKPLGVVVASWLAVRAGLALLPGGVGWSAIAAGGVLAGIGFTMALFIANLALAGPARDAAKVGILAASALAAVGGTLWLRAALPITGSPLGDGSHRS